MFRSLWFRLVGALAIVVLVSLVAVTFTNNIVTAREVDLYMTRAGRTWARQIAPILAREYSQTGSWVNAKQILNGATTLADDAERQRNEPNMHRGMMERLDNIDGMWGMMGFRLLLVDNDGLVIVDTQDEIEGSVLSDNVLEEGTPIIVEEGQVGALFITNNSPLRATSLRAGLIPSINRVVVPAALAAGLTALLMGTLLFRWITRPLTDLQRAAQAVSQGDLAVRVPVTTTDELGMLAKSFNQMTSQLDRQQQLRKQMVGDIAHELRTPLSVMQGMLEAMLDGVLDPNAAELRNLHSETRRLTRMVEDLRTLSLADEGQLKLELEPVDVGALIEQVVGQTSSLAETLQVTLRAEIEQTIPPITADGDRLIQVLTNLLSNALRYAPEKGHVTVRATQSEGRVRLAVEDDGPGISPEDLPFVFERFWRGDKSRNRGSGGSGIGLAIVKQLIEMHSGTVGVESQVGQGTTFWIEVPAN